MATHRTPRAGASEESKAPPPDSDLVAVDLTPHHFHAARILLAIEAALLLVLGVWGIIAALGDQATGATGPAVLIFHISLGHGILLAATGLLAAIATVRHRSAFWFTVAQMIVYLMLFMLSTGRVTWLSGSSADDLLHGALGIIGLGLLIWLSPRGLGGWSWVRQRDARKRS